MSMSINTGAQRTAKLAKPINESRSPQSFTRAYRSCSNRIDIKPKPTGKTKYGIKYGIISAGVVCGNFIIICR